MPARAYVAPTKYTPPTPLPRIGLSLTRTITGASMDFIANTLPEGPLTEWYDSLTTNRFFTVSGAPTVVTQGDRKMVRFDGIDDLMDLDLTLAQPRHVAIVGRIGSIQSGLSTIILGSNKANGSIIGSNSSNTSQYLNAGSHLQMNPALPADTSRHVWVARLNTTSSGLTIDGATTAGSAGGNNIPGIRLGGSHNVGNNTHIFVERVVVVPGAGTQDTAGEIYQELVAA